jgi:hypothetical protein
MARASSVPKITLPEARLVAAEAAKAVDPQLEVVSATAMHDSTFIEIMVVDNACRCEPCRVLVSVDRDVPRDELREEIADALRRHTAS